MRAFFIPVWIWCACTLAAATLGRVVPLVGGASDVVLDETRGLVYLPSSIENLVNVYSISKQNFQTTVPTDQTPLSAALSRDGKSLFVACYNSSVIDVIDLSSLVVSARMTLPAKPEAIAVGNDGRVLISTTGNGTGGASNLLLVYDPTPNATPALSSLSVTPPAPAAPTFPPPSGRPFLSLRSQLVATPDGSAIAGVNVPAAGSPTVFIYQTASRTVLRSRTIAGCSTILAISPDAKRVQCGVNLLDASTLRILAQQNLANSPYPIAPGTTFTAQATQGGSVFASNGQTLYTAYNVAPVQSPAAAANISQLMLNDPDNLLIHMGIQLPDNLAGKMVISSDGSSVYGLSDSGFVILPVGSIAQSALAVPSTDVALLTKDACGVTAQTSTATVVINNPGRGRTTATAQLLQYAGVANQANSLTAPTSRAAPGASTPQFTFTFNPVAARGTGTIAPADDFLIQSPEAVNIPDRVRLYQNGRDPDARGTVIPIPLGISDAQGLTDLVYDSTRKRVYIANAGLNRIEVYDIAGQQLLAPIKVGQLPASIALTPAGDTLYVANSGGENISIIDPDKMQTIGSVAWPPLAFNGTTAPVTPGVIAAGLSGPQLLMSDGSLWAVVAGAAVPRGVSVVLGQTAQGLPVKMPVPSSMVATPGGENILLATSTGSVFLYDGTLDDWVAGRQIFTAASQTGYIGPVAAGPKGQYFVANGFLLNAELVPLSGRTPGLVSAVAPVGTNTIAVFSPPVSSGVNVAPNAAPTVQIVDPTTGNSSLQVNALESPLTQVTNTGRANIGGRTMAVDSTGTTAYVITTSGLSIIPLSPTPSAQRPAPNRGGAVNLASYQLPVASNGLLAIFGQNLASTDIANSTPLPVVLGGTCVTLNNVALPLFMTVPTQINAQIPPTITAGSYPLVVHSIANQAASTSQQLAISKYAPAVLVDSTGQLALFHADGSYVNKNNPGNRDEPLTMYALGLGPTTGGSVTAGVPSPSTPLAKSGSVAVFFGNPSFKQAAIIVDWSGLAPTLIGVYQLNLRIPGFHINGDALPVKLEIGGVSSPTSGPVVPLVWVN